MIDLHCHILPGVDDGAADLDVAVEMARALVAVGFSTVAASPHMGLGPGGDVTRGSAVVARERLSAALRDAAVPLNLVENGEHHLTAELFDRIAARDVVSVGGRGHWLLTELPWAGISNVERVLFRLQTKSWRILLAHPERSESVPLALFAGLVERGVRMQLELGSFVGVFGDAVQRRANAMVEQGIAHVLATDLHRPEDAEAWLRAALGDVSRRYGEASVARALTLNPQLILDDREPDRVLPILEVS